MVAEKSRLDVTIVITTITSYTITGVALESMNVTSACAMLIAVILAVRCSSTALAIQLQRTVDSASIVVVGVVIVAFVKTEVVTVPAYLLASIGRSQRAACALPAVLYAAPWIATIEWYTVGVIALLCLVDPIPTTFHAEVRLCRRSEVAEKWSFFGA